MNISKKQLAQIIHENGGWHDEAAFYCQDRDGEIFPYKKKPSLPRGGTIWHHSGVISGGSIKRETPIKNWHQTILSRDEYFHLYPAPDADGWIEWNGGECPVDGSEIIDIRFPDSREEFGTKAKFRRWCHGGDKGDIIAYRLHKPETEITHESDHRTMEMPKPSIEQLAADYRNAKDYADRKQEEADAAKADAEVKLVELVAAGKAHGLVLSVAGPEPELVITDWRDLQVGDEVALTAPNGGGVNVGEVGVIRRIDGSSMSVNFPSQTGHLIPRSIANWMFIRRPSKGEANA